MTFFIVDDSRTARNLIKSYLGELNIGHDPAFLEAENGETAVVMLNSQSFDFAFLDWNMSTKMTGLDVLKEIRKIDKYKHVPVVMITSEIEKTNVIESLKAGASDYIVKPIDTKLFKEKITKLLKI
jgi:two-component system chemotaxis response regulator CheY